MKALALVWLALVVIACGDSSGPGPRAASVTGIAGDSQAAARGSQLPFPLSFTALDANGQPVPDVPVSWSVTPAGAATFAPPTSTTSASGVASTNVTLGATLGQITIQATVAGVSPVTYHAVVLDPCEIVQPYTFGQTVNASLASTDCNRLNQGWFYDFYDLNVTPSQQNVRISMASTVFDTYLDLWRDSDGSYVAFDDDIIAAIQQNSQLDVILPPGHYIIGANSYEQQAFGAYSISATARTDAMNGCRPVWVVRGVTFLDSIRVADCADSSATPKHYDVARIVALVGTVLTINHRSTAMNPALALYQFNPAAAVATSRTLVASNDDSLAGTNTNAFISYTVTANPGAFFDIIIGTSAGGEAGAYTLDISSSLTLSARRSEPILGRPEWWLQRSKH